MSMKEIEDLAKMWKEDSAINETALTYEAGRIPVLHHKYYNLYVIETLKLKKLKSDMVMLQKEKSEYYGGIMTPERMKELGWKPYQLKVLKSDVPKIVDQDKDIIDFNLQIGYFETLVKFLEDIIKQINNRNFILKTMLDWERFTSGSA